MAPRFIARQLSHPNGIAGHFIRRMMNRRNFVMNAFAVEQLALTGADRVLEIGFGGGVALPLLLETAAMITGVDRSRDSVIAARRRYADAVGGGRARFLVGEVTSLPVEGTFDAVLTVNTVYFWPSLDAAFAEIHRVTSPAGRIAVGFMTKEYMERMKLPTDIFTLRTPDDVTSALERCGYRDVRVTRRHPRSAAMVAVATR